MIETLYQVATTHGWALEVFLLVLATAVVRYVVKRIFDRMAIRLSQTNNRYDDVLLEAARVPVGMAIWIFGVAFAAERVGGTAQADIFEYINLFREVALVWLLTWFALRFLDAMEKNLVDARSGELLMDLTTAKAIGKLLRASVIITGLLLVLQIFGISISGALAFGGISGIAVGFAARDLLANFFGALMLFLDRPFSVGDWIRSPDREIEGTVEEIGWRLTRIRTFDKRPLYVPNSVFTSLAVENPSQMLNRRIYETIGLRYTDIHQMQPIVDDVNTMLRAHEAIDSEQTLMVNFVEFGASSIDFFVYCFTKTTVWTEFHAVKQDVLLKIADIIEQHNAEIAFPTRSVLLDSMPDPVIRSNA
jgi:MscS family membrane protein